MIRIVVADDHSIVRTGICRLLNAESGFEVVGEADDGNGLLDKCRELAPDVVIVDFNMPGMDGLDATRRIVQDHPDVRVLVLTMYDSEEFVYRFQQAGAAGFLPKKVSYEELPFAVRKVAAGSTYFTSSISRPGAMAAVETGEQAPSALLSEREFQVLLRLVRGMALNDIAKELVIGYSTVKTYKNRIMDKLNIYNIPDLTRYALRMGLIEQL
jgi:two-component system invasion response regulator UvrY